MIPGEPLDGRELHRNLRAGASGRTVHASQIWRAESFRGSADQPMTMRRALALNAVLERCDLIHVPGCLLFGSPLGRFSADESLREESKRAWEFVQTIGARDFRGHSDHLAPDFPGLLSLGIGGLQQQIAAALRLPRPAREVTFLQSVAVAIDGAAAHIRRWADHLASLADQPLPVETSGLAVRRCSTADEPRTGDETSSLLREQSQMAGRLASAAPQSFWEALQLVWIFHCMISADDRNAMAIGRLDQFLWPFYQADLAAGRLTRPQARQMLDHLVAMLTSLNEIQNIAIGGLTADGRDATNDLSYLVLDAVEAIAQPGANVTARIHAQTPRAFLIRCAEVVRTGIGYPAMVNDDVLVPSLVADGFPEADARNYCFVGCIETFIPGRMAPWADSRFNLLTCVNLVLFDGIDSLTGDRAAPSVPEPQTWDEFLAAYLGHMRRNLRMHVEELDAWQRRFDDRPDEFTSPLMSALVGDCIARGRDLNDGGALYAANHGVAAMGIGVTADALAAVKRFVYDQPTFTLEHLREMLRANFVGFETERQMLLRRAPKFGNNDDEVDAIAAAVTAAIGQECLKYRTPQGGRYWALMAANVANIYAGQEVGATPDGRLAKTPLSDASSPTFGRDVKGPTAAVQSIAKLPYRFCPGGNVVNMKLTPGCLCHWPLSRHLCGLQLDAGQFAPGNQRRHAGAGGRG